MILAILFGLSMVITLVNLYFSVSKGSFDYRSYPKKHEKDADKARQIVAKYKAVAKQ